MRLSLIPALPFCHVRLVATRPLPAAYPKTLTTWGDHIRKRRLDLGLLQRDVAKQIGVSQDAVFNWETHRAIPDVQSIPQIINFLGYCPWKPARTFSEKIKVWREAMGLTKEVLAKRLGVHDMTLANWESGKRLPSRRCRVILARFFADSYGTTAKNSNLSPPVI